MVTLGHDARTTLLALRSVGMQRRSDGDRQAAITWVAEEIGRLRAMTYHELLAYEGHALHHEMLAPSGEVMIREVQVYWDDRPGGDVRVMVDVWRWKGRRGVTAVQDGFIRAPDGSFVGE